MAYVPPDPSQPLPEEPDTQDLEDEYANVRDALAAAAAAAVAAGANATMSLGQFEEGAAVVGGGPCGIQGGAADSDVRITRRGTRYSPTQSPARPEGGARGAGPARALQPRTFLRGSGMQTYSADERRPRGEPPTATNPATDPATDPAKATFAWGKPGTDELNLRTKSFLMWCSTSSRSTRRGERSRHAGVSSWARSREKMRTPRSCFGF